MAVGDALIFLISSVTASFEISHQNFAYISPSIRWAQPCPFFPIKYKNSKRSRGFGIKGYLKCYVDGIKMNMTYINTGQI